MDISAEILKLENRIKERELADDGYYISHQYKDDCHQLYLLKCALRKNK